MHIIFKSFDYVVAYFGSFRSFVGVVSLVHDDYT